MDSQLHKSVLDSYLISAVANVRRLQVTTRGMLSWKGNPMPESNPSQQTIVVRQAGVEDAAALRTLRLEALRNKPEAFASDYEKESKNTVKDYDEFLMVRDV